MQPSVEVEKMELLVCLLASPPASGVCGWGGAVVTKLWSLEDSVEEVMVPGKNKLHKHVMISQTYTDRIKNEMELLFIINIMSFQMIDTRCAAGVWRVLGRTLQVGLALRGFVDVDSVGRQGSSQCGQTTSRKLSTANQLTAVNLGEGRGGQKEEWEGRKEG